MLGKQERYDAKFIKRTVFSEYVSAPSSDRQLARVACVPRGSILARGLHPRPLPSGGA